MNEELTYCTIPNLEDQWCIFKSGFCRHRAFVVVAVVVDMVETQEHKAQGVVKARKLSHHDKLAAPSGHSQDP